MITFGFRNKIHQMTGTEGLAWVIGDPRGMEWINGYGRFVFIAVS